MGKYSIRELEQLSGIKAHTIRIWEKRHNLIEPERTPTNIRYYSDEDLIKIINVSLLNNHGLKISKIVNMSPTEIQHKIMEISENQADSAFHIDQLVIAMIDMEEERFEKTLSGLILRYGFEETVINIIYPFLEKIGILWQTKNINPAQEHFISNLIRQKIIVAIDAMQVPSQQARKVLLYLPENEQHEIGLLFYHYIARKAGFRTYYLGQNVPHDDLIYVVDIHKPEILITSLISSPYGGVESYINKIQQAFPNLKILITGYQTQKLVNKTFNNVQIFRNALILKDLLKNI